MGQKLFSSALRNGYIEELDVGKEMDLGSGLNVTENGICLSSKARKDLILKFARNKRARGLEILEKLRSKESADDHLVKDNLDKSQEIDKEQEQEKQQINISQY